LNGVISQASDGSGVAAFTNLSVNTEGTYVLRAVAGFAPVVTNFSDVFIISNGPAAKLSIATQPSPSATAGTAFGTQPVIVVQDIFGNTASNSTELITATS